MEHCPICQYKGLNLRKHFGGSPECKTAWDQQRQMNAVTVVEAPASVVYSDISNIWSDDDTAVFRKKVKTMMQMEKMTVLSLTHLRLSVLMPIACLILTCVDMVLRWNNIAKRGC